MQDSVSDIAHFKERLDRKATWVEVKPRRVWHQGEYHVPRFIISEADEKEIIEKAWKEAERRRLVKRARRSVGSFELINGKRHYLSQPWRNETEGGYNG